MGGSTKRFTWTLPGACSTSPNDTSPRKPSPSTSSTLPHASRLLVMIQGLFLLLLPFLFRMPTAAMRAAVVAVVVVGGGVHGGETLTDIAARAMAAAAPHPPRVAMASCATRRATLHVIKDARQFVFLFLGLAQRYYRTDSFVIVKLYSPFCLFCYLSSRSMHILSYILSCY